MNLRPLSPFLISFALVFALLASARSLAQAVGPSSLAMLRSPPAESSSQLSAPSVALSRTFTLTREQAISALTQQLVAHFNLEGELQLDLLRSWTEPSSSSAAIELTITELPAQLSSNLLLRARFDSAGTSLGEVTLTVRAQHWRDAWVTRQPVNRGDTFDSSSFEVRRVDLLREREALPVARGELGLSFTRSLGAGRLITWRDVARRSLVRKGELVEVAAVDGPLAISMKALALQSGAAGDTITVRNLDSKKDIAAQVVAENRVQVRF